MLEVKTAEDGRCSPAGERSRTTVCAIRKGQLQLLRKGQGAQGQLMKETICVKP